MLFYEHILQFIALITGLKCWRKMSLKYLRVIVLIMALTCLNESIVIQKIDEVNTDFAYNIFSIIDMIVWSFVFYKIYIGKQMKMFLFIPLSLSILYSIIDILFLTGIRKLHLNSLMSYDMSIVLLAGNFLYSLLREEFYQPVNDPLFWISAACIGYHSLLFSNFVTLWLPQQYWDQSLANNTFDIVNLSAAIFYYLLLSIAFVTCTNYKFRRISFQ